MTDRWVLWLLVLVACAVGCQPMACRQSVSFLQSGEVSSLPFNVDGLEVSWLCAL